MSQMNFLYVGNFVPPHSTENDIKATLESMGFGVTPMQENRADPDHIRKLALQHDAMIWTTTWGYEQPLDYTLETIDMLKASGIPTIAYHLDLFFGVKRKGKPLVQEPMFHMEHMFSPDANHEESFRALGTGVNHHYLPPGVLEASCYLGRKRAAYNPIKLAFVGSYRYHPEWPHRTRLLAEAHNRYGAAFVQFGHIPERKVRGQMLNDLYASVPVVLGDSLCLDREFSTYWSDRVYETLGRGGLLVMPEIHALNAEDQFNGLLPTWPWEDWDRMEQEINYWIENPDEALALRGKLQAIVRAGHTYRHRWNKVLKTVWG